MSQRDRIYFVSDFHLGLAPVHEEQERLDLLISWMDHVSADATAIHIVGDMLDYWMEYSEVVPKGHFRLFARLYDLSRQGISIHYHVGNHDLWHQTYLTDTIGLTMHMEPIVITHGDLHIHVSHGDEMDSYGRYKIIRGLMRSSWAQWLYRRIHPDTGVRLMRHFSRLSREHHQHHDDPLMSNQKSISYIENMDVDEHSATHYVTGHWHHPIQHKISDSQIIYTNLGDWIKYYTYAVSDGASLNLKTWESKQ